MNTFEAVCIGVLAMLVLLVLATILMSKYMKLEKGAVTRFFREKMGLRRFSAKTAVNK